MSQSMHDRLFDRHAKGVSAGDECRAVVAPMRDQTVKVKAGSQVVIVGTATTDSVDLEGEVVLPGGVDTSYFPQKYNAVYINHDYAPTPIGKCVNFVKRPNGFFCTTSLVDSIRTAEILAAVRNGITLGISIGFVPTETRAPSREELITYGKACHTVVASCKLLEYSLTFMPANPDAVAQLVGKNIVRPEVAASIPIISDEDSRVPRVDFPPVVRWNR